VIALQLIDAPFQREIDGLWNVIEIFRSKILSQFGQIAHSFGTESLQTHIFISTQHIAFTESGESATPTLAAGVSLLITVESQHVQWRQCIHIGPIFLQCTRVV